MLAIEKKSIIIDTSEVIEKAFREIEKIEEGILESAGYVLFEKQVEEIYSRLDILWAELRDKIKANKFEDDLEEDEE